MILENAPSEQEKMSKIVYGTAHNHVKEKKMLPAEFPNELDQPDVDLILRDACQG